MALNYDSLMSMPIERLRQQYTSRDTILYALGVGVGLSDPTDPGELKFTYERDLQALPTMGVVLAGDIMRLSRPEFGIDYNLLLHAEQSLIVHRPIPAAGMVVSETKTQEIYDKGTSKGALMYVARKLFDETSGELLASVTEGWFLRGEGGFGGKNEGAPKPKPVPKERPADLTVALPSSLNQALIYRLSGDFNPLHVDPATASIAGFERPILHGLCAYGMAGRALMKVLCGNDPSRFRRLDLRFTSPVYPGEPLQLDVWNTGAGTASFRMVATTRRVVVEDFGLFEYA
jgi:acyl dehydratase